MSLLASISLPNAVTIRTAISPDFGRVNGADVRLCTYFHSFGLSRAPSASVSRLICLSCALRSGMWMRRA